jgi:hypothetical protein
MLSSATPKVINSYPSNGAANVRTSTSIGVTYSVAIDRTSITTRSVIVTSEQKGTIAGITTLSTNGRTIIFKPTQAFTSRDRISIDIPTLRSVSGELAIEFRSSFTTAAGGVKIDTGLHSDDPILEWQLHGKRGDIKGRDIGTKTVPQIMVHNILTPSEGNIYIANYRFTVENQINTYRMILDKNGNLLKAFDGNDDYFNDFKPHPNGTYSYFDVVKGIFIITDSTFNIIDSVKAANGYLTDGHELQVSPEGNYVIIADEYELVNMSKLIKEGDSAAAVMIPVIQEFDKDKNLVFEWRSIDHFSVLDATHENMLAASIDYCHANAVEFDADSNILLSSRHMDEITKISHKDGSIIWRLGGKNNQFTFLDDTIPLSHQHDIRRTAAGTYTMYDNGNFRSSPLSYSRGVEYDLDQKNKTAHLVWQYRRIPDGFGSAMGSVQRLPNGNTLIGWGSCPVASVSEVSPNNDLEFEMLMDSNNYSYRAYKYDANYIHQGNSSSVAQQSITPAFSLSCSSNPVIDHAEITCVVSEPSELKLSVYDILGHEVKLISDRSVTQGSYAFPLATDNLSAGVYYLRATANGFSATQKIVIAK